MRRYNLDTIVSKDKNKGEVSDGFKRKLRLRTMTHLMLKPVKAFKYTKNHGTNTR